jgi:uncharacterized protein
MSYLENLKQGYKDFAEGNIEAVIAPWHPDIVWVASTGFPYILGDGIFVGAQAIIKGVFAKVPEYIDEFIIEISDFVDGGDKIVMVGYYTGIWNPTGKRFKANATHTWTIKDGIITRFFQAVDTAEIVNP